MIISTFILGNSQKNPWIFKHNRLTSYRFLVNEESHPAEYFKPDFEKDKYMREYRNLLDCVGISFSNSGL